MIYLWLIALVLFIISTKKAGKKPKFYLGTLIFYLIMVILSIIMTVGVIL